jgi:sugar lactone lactonase YvrE
MNNPLLIAPADVRLTRVPPQFGNYVNQFLVRLTLISLWFLSGTQILQGQVPTISSIAPTQGPIAGGTVVTVTGTSLQGATLALDGVAITPTTLSGTQASFTTPPHDNGIASLEISTASGNVYGEFLFVPPPLSSLPPGYITTVAGIGHFVGFHRPATQSAISVGDGIAFDAIGNMYLAEPNFNWVSVVNSNGIREPFAGTNPSNSSNPGPSNTSNIGNGGPALNINIVFPRGVTTDKSGKVYIADQGQRVWSVDSNTGIASVIAGNGTAGYSGDGGPALNAVVGDVTHITGDGNGTVFFIDYNNTTGGEAIRRITPDGIIATVAGNDTVGFSGDGGPATQAQFNFGSNDLGSIALDPSGNLFIADTANQRIRRVDAKTQIITTFASKSPTGLANFQITNLFAVACDPQGNVYYSFNPGSNPFIVELDPTAKVLAMYGGGFGSSPDGTAISSAALGDVVRYLAIDPSGNIVYSTNGPLSIRRLNITTGKIETLAGVGVHPIGEIGPAIAAVLSDSDGALAFLPTGELLLADDYDNLLREIDQHGNFSTIAGYGIASLSSQDFPLLAINAPVGPTAVTTDASGQIYIASQPGVCRIDLQGYLNVLAGDFAGPGFSGDGGPAVDAQFDGGPWDIAFDSGRNLFIADSGSNRIRRVDATSGVITTVAGSGPVTPIGANNPNANSDTGDGGPAVQATLNNPRGIAFDSKGTLYIASGNDPGIIRKVDQNGTISTFVTIDEGNVTKLTFDGADNLYAIIGFQRLMRFDPSGNATVLAGGSIEGFSGDGGPASQAMLSGGIDSSGIAIDAEGDIFFVDGQNLRVRAIRMGAAPTPNVASMNPSRLSNLSCRAQVGTGANQLIVGFAVSTSGTSGNEPVLVRASGPALGGFGVSGVLSDPQLTLNNTRGVIASNNGWDGNAQVASTAATVGAFAWTSTTSHDSALVETLPNGAYTAQITGASGDTGVALAEVYDATPTGTFTSTSPRLVNLSARVMVGTGNNILIAGFVIAGTSPKAVLIRASGPALSAFGVPSVLPDPQLSLYRSNSDGSNTLLQTNTGWAGNSYIATASASVGAFSWGTAATPDSAILVALPPGAYTAEVSGASGDTGVALVEVYDAP